MGQPRSIGIAAESLIADHLGSLGWRVLARNLRLGREEIDLLAIDPGPPGRLVAVEVRSRGRRDFGIVEETFGWQKRSHLRASITRLAAEGRLPDGTPLPHLPIAVDLIVVEPPARIRHHRDVLA